MEPFGSFWNLVVLEEVQLCEYLRMDSLRTIILVILIRF